MRLIHRGVFRSGNDLADRGIRAVEFLENPDGHFVYTTTGRFGSLVAYRLGANGQAEFIQERALTGGFAAAAMADLRIADWNGERVLFFGSTASQLLGYVIGANGELGVSRVLSWASVEAAIMAGNTGLREVWARFGSNSGASEGSWRNALVGFETIGTPQGTFAVSAGAMDNFLTLLRLDTESGEFRVQSRLGPESGLGLAEVSAFDTVEAYGATWVIVGSAAASLLAVVRFDPATGLTAVDQVLDTRLTHLGSVQTLVAVEVGGQVFVVAGGGDDGLNLLTLLPSGQLVHLQALSHAEGRGLMNIVRLSAQVTADEIRLFVTSQGSEGVSLFAIPLSGLGLQGQTAATGRQVLTGTDRADLLISHGPDDTLIGGAGADVLVATRERARMTGGAGEDVFVITRTARDVQILDFEPGRDRLDLSDLPMLRSPLQLGFAQTANGATLDYRGVSIGVRAANGAPLSLTDLFPLGFESPDRFPIIPWEPDPVPVPLRLTGTAQNDTLDGDSLADTLTGAGGNDLLRGAAGRDVLNGGTGADTLFGGDGADTMYGEADNDLMFGGSGNDLIYGGDGNDRLRGEIGNDTLHGGAGDDSLYGATGSDLLFGGAGNDLIAAAAGFDTVYGGDGNDEIHGGGRMDQLHGDGGNDTLFGDSGADHLFGGDGNDILWGGTGRDTLVGGRGRDTLYGGSGADHFVWVSLADSPASGPDRIMDFQPGIDRINLSDLGPGLRFVLEFSGRAGETRFDSRSGLVQVDLTGDRQPDFAISLTPNLNILATDFIF
jgi:Ca2+-binding RTX toxin-like protein